MSPAEVSTPIVMFPEKSSLADVQNSFQNINYKYDQATQKGYE